MADITIWQGDERYIPFTVYADQDETGGHDLSGSTFIYKIGNKSPHKITRLNKTSGIVITDAVAGDLEVQLTEADTVDIPPGEYVGQLFVDTANQQVVVAEHVINIEARL